MKPPLVKFLIKFAKFVLEQKSYIICKSTQEKDLAELISYLEPKATNIPLKRIGGVGDGAYLLPEDFQGIALCLSPGSNQQWAFERDIFDRYEIPSAIMDRAENMPHDLYPEIKFTDSWLGTHDNSQFTSISTWLSRLNLDHESELMLQMDIEGAEYENILAMPLEILNRFRIMVIEFHYSHRYTNGELFQEFYSKVFSRLKENHEVVHFHANNSCGDWNFRDFSLPIVFELTLLRRDRIGAIVGLSEVPHDLDSDCVPDQLSSNFRFRI